MFSATPSGAWIPAMMAADTGIPLTQRAQAFVLTPGHPNQIAAEQAAADHADARPSR